MAVRIKEEKMEMIDLPREAKNLEVAVKVEMEVNCASNSEKPLIEKDIRIKVEKEAKQGGEASNTHNSAVAKALLIKKKVLKGENDNKNRKIQTPVNFKRPKTYRPPRNPKYPRNSVPKRKRLDCFNIIRHPMTSEAAMKKAEENNIIVFIVNIRANKKHIRSAVEKLFDVKVIKVNALIKPNGFKKAYVQLSPDYKAVDVCNKMGII